MEVWIKITSFKKYEVSNKGNVRNIKTNHVLKKSLDLNGYEIVCLQKEKGQKTIAIHRLVAGSFIPNPYNKKTVNHKDGNKLNNESSNLEWNTYSENMNHSFLNGLRRVGKHHPMARKIKNKKTGIIYDTLKDAAKDIGISSSCLCNQLKGKQKNKTNLSYL